MTVKIRKIPIKSYILFFSLLFCTFAGGGFAWTGLLLPIFGMIVCASGKGSSFRLGIVLFFASALLAAISLVFTEGNFQTGLYECEKMLLFYLAFLAAGSEKSDSAQFPALFAVALAVAIPGILGYIGLLKNIPENVFVSSTARRLQSSFKYANSAACFLGIGYMAAVKCICTTVSEKTKKLYLWTASVILTALYLTFSKAFLPLFILAGTFVMARDPKIQKVFLSQNLAVILFVLPIRYFSMWSVPGIAAGMTLLCIFIAGFLPQLSVTVRKIPIFRIWCALIVFAAAAAIVYAALKPGVFATLGTRFVYYRDTVRFMKENFWFSPRMLIGFGPGSWRILYYGFQSTPYNVICLHNGFLQLLFENGSFFTILFFGMLLRAVYLHCKHGDRFRCALLMMILVHSLVDFDLSFGCILAVAGLTAGKAYAAQENCNETAKIQCVLKMTVIVFAALLWVYMAAEYGMRQQFERHYLRGENQKAYQNALLLEKLCPRDSSLQTSLAALSKENGEPDNVVKMHLEQAAALSPHNARPVLDLARYTKDAELFNKYCSNYIALNPMQPSAYANVFEALQYRLNKDLLSKKEYDENAALIRRQMNSVMK